MFKNVVMAIGWLILVAMTWSSFADSAMQTIEPPLAPGEIYVRNMNCGVVVDEKNVNEQVFKYLKSMKWTGACEFGLAHGEGDHEVPGSVNHGGTTIQSMWYGRGVGPLRISRGGDPSVCGTNMYFRAGNVSVSIIDRADPYSPVWTDSKVCYEGSGTHITDADRTYYNTIKIPCGNLASYIKDRVGNCSASDLSKDQFDAYGLEKNSYSKGEWVREYFVCPDPKSPSGCEVLWTKVAGQAIENIKKVVAQAVAEYAEKKAKTSTLMQPFIEDPVKYRKEQEAKALAIAEADTARAIAEETKALASAEEAKRLAEQKAKELEEDRKIALQEQAERDKIDAKEKEAALKKAQAEEAALQVKVNKMNAGELFALADQNLKAGNRDKAMEYLRLLMSKFPTSPLVAVAAQQLIQIKPLTEQEKRNLGLKTQ